MSIEADTAARGEFHTGTLNTVTARSDQERGAMKQRRERQGSAPKPIGW